LSLIKVSFAFIEIRCPFIRSS